MMTETTSATQLSKVLEATLGELGFRVRERETSKGAVKAWLTSRVASGGTYTLEVLCATLQDAHPKLNIVSSGGLIRGEGFEIEIQRSVHPPLEFTLFLAVYRNTHAGLAYEMGVDC